MCGGRRCRTDGAARRPYQVAGKQTARRAVPTAAVVWMAPANRDWKEVFRAWRWRSKAGCQCDPALRRELPDSFGKTRKSVASGLLASALLKNIRSVAVGCCT